MDEQEVGDGLDGVFGGLLKAGGIVGLHGQVHGLDGGLLVGTSLSGLVVVFDGVVAAPGVDGEVEEVMAVWTALSKTNSRNSKK